MNIAEILIVVVVVCFVLAAVFAIVAAFCLYRHHRARFRTIVPGEHPRRRLRRWLRSLRPSYRRAVRESDRRMELDEIRALRERAGR